VELASSAQFQNTTGTLVHNGKTMDAPFSADVETQDRLWQTSCELAGVPEEV